MTVPFKNTITTALLVGTTKAMSGTARSANPKPTAR